MWGNLIYNFSTTTSHIVITNVNQFNHKLLADSFHLITTLSLIYIFFEDGSWQQAVTDQVSVLSQSQTTGFPCVTVELPLHLGKE